ncbi:hypothetical protein PCANC_16412 [Puccinia coronata f. sp. avenae]|uniref:Uncharacterized protein n=1 Tax=Puccinia coronata f. sp. avenae TaxID=200324 RepID=A0A2N5SYI6_9BASI|nr:hypothetical protein PCANC_16412 [Puccinia coronata f. sp. avenae]
MRKELWKSIPKTNHMIISTAGINRSNTAVRAVLEQPCSTGGPAGTGRTNLSDQLALASVGQCLSDHRSNTAVQAPLKQPCSTG